MIILNKKQELEKDKLFFSKILLLEKLKTGEEIFKLLNKVIEEEKEENNKNTLKRIIAYILEEKLRVEDRDILLKQLEKEEKDMVLEVIRKENEKLINQGRIEGKKEAIMQTAIQLLKIGVKEDIISKATNIKIEKLEKIKREIVDK